MIKQWCKYALVLLVLLPGITSCKKSPHNPVTVSTADVYLAGYISPSGTGDQAAYWKNGNLTTLSDFGVEAKANGLAVNLGDVYAAGYIIQSGYKWPRTGKTGRRPAFPTMLLCHRLPMPLPFQAMMFM